MTTYSQGEIILVPFPYMDFSASKQRPAVVMSSASYNATHPDVILAPITSRRSGTPDEVAVTDWRAAGLIKPSAIKPILASFEIPLVIRKLGTLSDIDRVQVRTLFARVLDLP
jgi:mRNA interferase MazF